MSTDLPLVDALSYKWIFVGGKGGVGKTTTSCSIAVALTRSRNRVLLVSTDPASNIGDTFQQHFAHEPLPVQGVPKLWAMEYSNQMDSADDSKPLMGMPGVDELSALSALFDSIERDDFDVVVFDTAPTGHTMRLLQLPQNCEAIMGGIGMFGGAAMAAIGQLLGGLGTDDISGKMQRLQNLLLNAAKRLSNPMECTFICVLLAEFSPLFETERLIQFLNDKQIETHILVVNQVMDSQTVGGCQLCRKRYDMQQKYLHDIHDLYDDFLIVEVPLQENEIKGLDSVHNFSGLLARLFSTV